MMMTQDPSTQAKRHAIAATFADQASAKAAYDLLRLQGFEHVWLATTKPAEADTNGDELENRSQNQVEESTEGMLGTIGRFFSGEGNSLRRSLEDHGVDPLDASEIDEALLPLGAVVTTYGEDRATLAAEILRGGATKVYVPVAGTADSFNMLDPVPSDAVGTASVITSRVLVESSPVPGMPGAVEQIFVERRIVAADSNAEAARSSGLNDLL